MRTRPTYHVMILMRRYESGKQHLMSSFVQSVRKRFDRRLFPGTDSSSRVQTPLPGYRCLFPDTDASSRVQTLLPCKHIIIVPVVRWQTLGHECGK
ncbi:hypothetical protein LSAT2_031629 [Lamellibrachia satsuma]|nr:hypothetical protein LSAT2_031629 [Lamellibrachia satsuma]